MKYAFDDIKMLRMFGVTLLATAGVMFLMLLLDDRTLDNGENVWIKPMRFALAFGLQVLTYWWIGWFTKRQELNDAWFSWSVGLTVVVIFIELLLITIQGARGVPSHFNYSTWIDRQIFSLMGIGTAGIFIGFLGMFIGQLLKPLNGFTTLGINLGLIFAAFGGLVGV